MSTTAPIPNPLSGQDNTAPVNTVPVNTAPVNTVPVNTANTIKIEDQNGTTNGAPPQSNDNTSALNLFAPAQGDFNEGAYDIDINELFHDCYFEEYNPTLEEDHAIPSLPPPTPKVETALPDIIPSKTDYEM